MNGLASGLGGLYIFVVFFLLYLALVWLFLPFAIFGSKKLLRQLINETQRTNSLLEAMAGSRASVMTPPSHTSGSGPSDAPAWVRGS